MAFTFIKAQGGQIGNSLVELERLDTATKIIEEAKKKNVGLYIPVDSIAADAFSNTANVKTCGKEGIPDGWMGLDIGPETEKLYADVIGRSRTLLWNGPMGVFEMSHFEHGTISVAKAIAAATKKGAYSLVGGGDSVAAINKYNLASEVSYVSTGGGALLEYMESGTAHLASFQAGDHQWSNGRNRFVQQRLRFLFRRNHRVTFFHRINHKEDDAQYQCKFKGPKQSPQHTIHWPQRSRIDRSFHQFGKQINPCKHPYKQDNKGDDRHILVCPA
jgi:hypothetical protein